MAKKVNVQDIIDNLPKLELEDLLNLHKEATKEIAKRDEDLNLQEQAVANQRELIRNGGK
jgi:hypothetical protein